jgi:glycerate dehydrogenase
VTDRCLAKNLFILQILGWTMTRRPERIVFLERNTFNISFRKSALDHQWVQYGETAPDEVIARFDHGTMAICNKLPLRAEPLKQLPELRLIAVVVPDVDNVDLEYCHSHNIAVCNRPGYVVNLPWYVLMTRWKMSKEAL